MGLINNWFSSTNVQPPSAEPAIPNDIIKAIKEGRINSTEDILAFTFADAYAKNKLSSVTPKVAALLNNPDIVMDAEFVKSASPELLKAVLARNEKEPLSVERVAFKFDDVAEQDLLNHIFNGNERPSLLTYQSLRAMTYRSTIVSAILLTKIAQFSNFTRPQRERHMKGFTVRLKDRTKAPTPSQLKKIERYINFYENLGFEGYTEERKDLTSFCKKFIMDSLTFDQACAETVYDRMGIPFAFKAVDAASIRPFWNKDTKKWSYNEVLDGRVVQKFTAKEMAFEVRNPTADRNFYGYGVSELERLVHIVTSHLFAEEYNKRIFKQGHNLSGLINLKGNVPRAQMQEFKRDFYSMVTGVENSHKVLITNAPQGLDVNNTIRTPEEMGFQVWMDYLTKVGTAVYQMDPSEINFFITGNTGSANPIINNHNDSGRFERSSEKGLFPLLVFMESFFNRRYQSKIDDEFEFAFVGWNSIPMKEEVELANTQLMYKTLNEVRTNLGLPPIEGVKGEVMNHPIYNQMLMGEHGLLPTGDPAPQEDAQDDTEDGPSDDQVQQVQQKLEGLALKPDVVSYILDAFKSGQVSPEEIDSYILEAKQENNDTNKS